MDFKIYLYVFFTMFSIFMLNGVNFNGIMKKGKEIEAKLLVLTLSFALSYMLTNFIADFVS